MRTGFWWGDVLLRGDFENLDVDRKIILKWIFKNWDEVA